MNHYDRESIRQALDDAGYSIQIDDHEADSNPMDHGIAERVVLYVNRK